MLWLNADGMATVWVMYSLSYWHNHLGFPGQTNCTERGPDCFSVGLNVSCRTETSAYTQLRLDESGIAVRDQPGARVEGGHAVARDRDPAQQLARERMSCRRWRNLL